MTTSITIDQEFKSLLPALSTDELSRLEVNLTKQGCLDPLKTWNGILVDGHNRHEICTRKKIKFQTVSLEFADREAAKLWMLDNAIGQRNLSPASFTWAIGLRHEMTKKTTPNPSGRNQTAEVKGKNCPQPTKPPSTAKAIAKQAGVNEKTVKNAAAFVAAAKKLGIQEEAKAGEFSRGKSKVIATAKNAIPELREMLKVGEIPFKTASVVATLSAEDQTKAVLGGVYGVNQAAKRVVGKDVTNERNAPHMPSDGKSCAIMAIIKLDRILDSDTEFEWAMNHIIAYCQKRMNNNKNN